MPLTVAEAEAKFAPSIPPQLRAQIARGAELQQLHVNGPAPETPEGAPPTEPTAEASSEPAPQPAEPAPKPPAPTPPPQQNADAVDWEARARSAQGRVDALTKRLNDMENFVASLQAAKPTVPVEPSPLQPPVASSLTPEDEQTFGPELIDVMKRAAADVAHQQFSKLSQTVEGLGQRVSLVGQSMATRSVEQLRDTLTASVPDWQAQNHDPGFLAWLAEIDPYAGRARQELLRQAWDLHDSQRVIKFFQGYRSELNALNPQTPPANSAPAGKPGLERFAAPGKATSAAPPSPAAKTTYTRADIATFYTDKRRGKYRGREADAQRIEQDIFAAQTEGRIT